MKHNPSNQIVPATEPQIDDIEENIHDDDDYKRTVPMFKVTPHKPSQSHSSGVDLTQSNFHQFSSDIRQNKVSHFCDKLLSTAPYRILSVCVVITALFLNDITRCVFDKNADYPVQILMIAVFLFLFLDIILQSITYPKYTFSYFFWLDFIGTMTLLADMPLALSLFGYDAGQFTVARGSRAGRAARSAGSLRLTRLMKVARLMRIARLVRFLASDNSNSDKKKRSKGTGNKSKQVTWTESDFEKYHNQILDEEEYDDEKKAELRKKHQQNMNAVISEHELDSQSTNNGMDKNDQAMESQYRKAHSSKIGVIVSDSITQHVVFSVLLIVSLTPIFTAPLEESYSAMYLALEWFDGYINTEMADAGGVPLSSHYFDILLDEHPNIVLLKSGDIEYKNELDTDRLRDEEMLRFDGEHSEIILDISKDVRFGHGMGVGFTLVIVFLFAGLAFLITRNINKLVVIPIERMTRLIQEFTKKVCFLGGDFDDQASVVANLLETEVIEAAIGTLSSIFNAIKGPTMTETKSNSLTVTPQTNKTEIVSNAVYSDLRPRSFVSALPKTEGKTFIKSRDSIISINISESKRIFVSEKEIEQKIKSLTDSHHIVSFSGTRSLEKHPELVDVASAMQHPIASEYFKSYCYAHASGESYSFIRAVSAFHSGVRREFDSVYKKHICEDAEEKILVNAVKRRKLVELFNTNKFGADTFDEFRMSIIQSLQNQIFPGFGKSKWATAYLISKQELKRKNQRKDIEAIQE